MPNSGDVKSTLLTRRGPVRLPEEIREGGPNAESRSVRGGEIFRPIAVGYLPHVQALCGAQRRGSILVTSYGVDRADPRDIAKSAMTAGRFHEVVTTTSKVIHRSDLDSRDQENLRWAKDILTTAGDAEAAVVSMPSTTELSGPSDPIRILRRAAQPDEGVTPDKLFKSLSKALGDVLGGKEVDQGLIESLKCVRALFSVMSRMSLHAEVVTETEQTSPNAWLPSMMTLPS